MINYVIMKHEAINGPLSDSVKFIAHKGIKLNLKLYHVSDKREYCDVDVSRGSFNQKKSVSAFCIVSAPGQQEAN